MRHFLLLLLLAGCMLNHHQSAVAFSPAWSSISRRPTTGTRASTRNLAFVRHATEHQIETPTQDSWTKPQVQREYETFQWTANSNTYNINYRVEGPITGTPVLLVHGFGANVNHFRYQFPALVAAGYRVHAVDLLGFGASDKPKEEHYCIELFVSLLRDFIKAMNTDKKWIIAGNSIGGLCCLSAAEKSPEQVAGVVLFNCAGGMTGFRYDDVPMLLRPFLYFVQKVVLGPQMGGGFFSGFKTRENVESILRQQGVYGDQTNVDDELMEILLGPSNDDGAEQVFLKTFAGPPGPTPESILPTVQCPVLALWGGADPWTPVDSGMHPGSKFGDYNSDFTLEVIPDAGHCPHDECPDAIHAKMLPWMETVLAKEVEDATGGGGGGEAQ